MKTILMVLLAGVLNIQAQNAPYVDGFAVNSEFSQITAGNITDLAGKKVLYCTRSFGMNVGDGLARLNSIDPIYGVNRRWNIRIDNGDTLAADIYDTYDFVHCIIPNSPASRRLAIVDSLVRNHFGGVLDAVLVHPYKYMSFADQDYYFAVLDSLQKDFPGITIVYCGQNIYPEWNAANYATNKSCTILRNRAVERCRGIVPYFDHLDVLATTVDGTVCGFYEGDSLFRVMCADYNNGTDQLHPNTGEGEERLGKAFLVMMMKLFSPGFNADPDTTAPSVPGALHAVAASAASVTLTWNASSDTESGVKYYRVFRDGSAVGATTLPGYTDDGLEESTQYSYTVIAVNNAALVSDSAGPAVVTTMADAVAPVITGVADTRDANSVEIEFSEPLERTSAETAGNYAISGGITVTAAVLAGNTVTLATSTMTGSIPYTLTVSNVTDASAAGNTIAAGAQATFEYIDITMNGMTGGYWAMDTVIGGVVTDGIGDNDGTLIGAEWTADGHTGGALVFDGVDTVDLGTGSFGMDSTNEFTFACWFKPSDNNGDLGRRGTYVVPFWAELRSGKVRTCIRTSGTNYLTGTTAVGLDTWNHFALTYRDGERVAYVNGAVDVTDTVSGTLANGTQAFTLGLNYTGLLDEVYLLNRSLDSAAIARLMDGTFGSSTGNADSLAVRAILDANGKTSMPVSAVTDWSGDRVVRLQLNELGIADLTPRIGDLTALEELYAYGDTSLGLPYLTSVPAEIGNCTALTTLALFFNDIASLPAALGSLPGLAALNVSDNALTDLPPELAGLTNLTSLSLAANRLCGLAGAAKTWADTYDPDWEDTQECTGGVDERFMPKAGAVRSVTYYTTNGEIMHGIPQQAGVYFVQEGDVLKKVLIME